MPCITKGCADDPSRTVVYFRAWVCVDQAATVRYLVRLNGTVHHMRTCLSECAWFNRRKLCFAHCLTQADY